MSWKPDKNRPVCPQICEQMCVRIVRGELEPGGRLPSVREFALEIGVTPNTVQHAFELLEQKQVLYSVRNVGWFASEHKAVAEQTVQWLAKEKTAAFFEEMQQLGLGMPEIKRFVKEWEE